MARKRHSAEEIVSKLRQVDVLTAQGRPVADAVRAIGVTRPPMPEDRSTLRAHRGDRRRRFC